VTAAPEVTALSFTDSLFAPGADIALSFSINLAEYPNASPAVTINNKESNAVLKDGKYTVSHRAMENMEINIGLGYAVTLHPDPQIAFEPSAGRYVIEKDQPFRFYFDVPGALPGAQISVTVGNTPDYPYTPENGRYSVSIGSVTRPLDVLVKVSNNTAVSLPEKAANVYAASRTLFIETAETADVSVYDLTGKALFGQRVSGTASVTLRAGFYLVKVGKETHKIIVK
jgi:hypothetical protein